MKKMYSKPEIMFENFTLNEGIANTCEVSINNQTQDVCGIPQGTGGETLFLSSVSGCSMHIDDDVNNGYCYHIPIDTKNLFNS